MICLSSHSNAVLNSYCSGWLNGFLFICVCAGTIAPKTWNRLRRRPSPSTAWCSSICTSPSPRPTPSSTRTAAVPPAAAELTAPAPWRQTVPAATAAAPVETSTMILQLLLFWRTSSPASGCLPQGAPNWPSAEQHCMTVDFTTVVAPATASLWALGAGECKVSSDWASVERTVCIRESARFEEGADEDRRSFAELSFDGIAITWIVGRGEATPYLAAVVGAINYSLLLYFYLSPLLRGRIAIAWSTVLEIESKLLYR